MVITTNWFLFTWGLVKCLLYKIQQINSRRHTFNADSEFVWRGELQLLKLWIRNLSLQPPRHSFTFHEYRKVDMDLIRYGNSDNNITGNDIDLHRNGNISNDKHNICSCHLPCTRLTFYWMILWCEKYINESFAMQNELNINSSHFNFNSSIQ